MCFAQEWQEEEESEGTLDEVGGEGEDQGQHEGHIVLALGHFVKGGEGVVDQEVGDGDLGVEDDGEGAGLDVVAEGRDEAGYDGGAEVEQGEDNNYGE